MNRSRFLNSRNRRDNCISSGSGSYYCGSRNRCCYYRHYRYNRYCWRFKLNRLRLMRRGSLDWMSNGLLLLLVVMIVSSTDKSCGQNWLVPIFIRCIVYPINFFTIAPSIKNSKLFKISTFSFKNRHWISRIISLDTFTWNSWFKSRMRI